ncbi:MAG: sulfatase-like hydrolase/transferase, partial [Bacteroidota bacterium]
AMVERADRYVGQIVDKLAELGLSEHTLVMFTSDNGVHQEAGNAPDFFDSNGPLRGYKRDLYEGGIRVPFIAKWPGKIQADTKTDHLSAFWDLMPTLADIAQVDDLPPVDGISLLPTLTGAEQQVTHDYLYWEFIEQGGKQAIRQGDWKAVRLGVYQNPDSPIELYHLKTDPSETTNLARENPGRVAVMDSLMKASHTYHPIFALHHSEGVNQKAYQVD